VSKQSEIIDRLTTRLNANSGVPLKATSEPRPPSKAPGGTSDSPLPPTAEVADNGTPLNAKRNRSGVCGNPNVHLAHEGCPGRRRAAKIERPVDSAVRAELEDVYRKFGGHWIQADQRILGRLSPDEIETHDFDLKSYEIVPFTQEGKFISFFTSVRRTNAIILDYAGQDLLPLTLRQIHYQMVVRHKDYPNMKTSYDHLNIDLVQARMSGLVPWNAIDDPTRGVHELTSWDSVRERLAASAAGYHISRWKNQEQWPMVLVEKDAALGVIARACEDFDVPYASLKGYGSVSALRNQVAAHCLRVLDQGKKPVIIHLSDHDASGWDMPRNLVDYLDLLVGQKVDVRHIALTLDQITTGYGDGKPLPPDPVKDKDPRSKKYIEHLAERGLEPGAWEMDALPPKTLHELIVNEIESCRDEHLWKVIEDTEREEKQAIREVAERWTDPRANVAEVNRGITVVKELIQLEEARLSVGARSRWRAA
jgi:hypothetical protein